MKNICSGPLLPQFKTQIKINRAMKLTCALLFTASMGVFANGNAQSMRVNINVENVSTKKVLSEIEKQTDYLFVYNKKEVDLDRKTSVNAVNKTTADVLSSIFEGTDIVYAIEGENIMLMRKEESASHTALQEEKKITGTVVDASGMPIIGANVMVKGTTNGTITDFDGKFVLNVPDEAVLQISYIGYTNQEVKVGNKSELSVTLKEDTELLDEVVVVGYGVQKKVNLTGAVSNIKANDITKSSTSNISNALVGRIPGLIGMNESGKPGTGSKLYIRGMGTWNNSNPLMIVDGVERDFTTMDPNEVESISILKDAAAAAVYGSRAANGVILITTKRGKTGKPIIALDTYYGIKDFTRYPELANPYEWAVTRNKALELDGVESDDPRYFSPEQIEKFKNGERGTDWFKETFKKSTSQYYANVNLSGGNDRVKYFVSFGHHNEDGMIDNFNFKRFNVRSNIDVKVTDRFNISVDLDAITQTYKTPGWDVEYLFGLVPRQNPTLEDYYPNGLPYYGGGGEHLLEMVYNSGYEKQTSNALRSTFKAEYRIPGVDGLIAKAMFFYGKNYSYNKKFFTPYSMFVLNDDGDVVNEKVVGEKTKLDESFNQGGRYTYNVSLNYNKTFGKHDLGLLLLYEQEAYDKNWFSAYRTNFISNSVPQLSAGGDLEKDNAGSASEWSRNGVVGRVNYAYDGTYLLEASFRYDGSMTFPKGSRYGFFPSVSAAWRLSNESFIKDNFSNIDNLKFRVSYGTLGNDQVALWQYMSSFVYSSPATIGNNNINSISVYNNLVPNPNITWEKSSTLNIGLDGTLWRGLLGFELEYFYKKTSNILAPQIRTIPGTFGATLPDVNYGILKNNGVEITLTHMNTINDFTYNLGFNFSFTRNKVVRFDESETTPDYYKVVGKSFTHVSDKRPYSGLVGMQAIGIFQSQEEIDAWPKQFNGGQKPGDIKYADVNNDGVINENDLTIVSPYGSVPEIVYGFNSGFSWKGLEFSALFQGVAHKAIMLNSYGTIMFKDGNSNYFKYLYEDSWSPENVDAKYPRAYVGANTNNNRNSNIWVKNGNYLRLKNVEIAYNFPKSILNKMKVINGLRLYINGTNLLTFDNLDVMDPESPSGSSQYYPQMKSVNFGLKLTY